MTGIRYTYENTGIFRAMRKLDDAILSSTEEQELYDAENIFDRELDVPDVCTLTGMTECYFTPKGSDHFKEELSVFSYYLRQYLGGRVQIITEDVPDSFIIYKDDYQFVKEVRNEQCIPSSCSHL